MRTERRVPRLAGSPAGANRPAEAALCLESRARISGRALTIRNMPDSAIHFGAHSRPMLIRNECQLAAARLRCKPRSHAVDGLAMSDATDRSPLHSGTKPGTKGGTKGGSRRCKARYKARYTAAQGGTKQDVQLCCQGVCGAEAKQLCGRSQTSRGGGLRWQVPQAVRTLEPARGWWQRTPRVAVPAYRPLSLAGIVHTIQRSSYAALPRAFSGR